MVICLSLYKHKRALRSFSASQSPPCLSIMQWIGWQLLQFIHQMRDHAISTQSMVLVIDILHDLPIPDRIKSLLHVLLVSLIESVSEQCNHRHADGLIVGGIVLQLLCLSPVLPCDDGHCQHTQLLNPVFLHCLRNHFPVQRHPFLPFLYLNPSASAVIIRNTLNPCAVVAVPHRALLPGTVVAVPDRCIHIGHCHGDAGHAGIVAGITAGG